MAAEDQATRWEQQGSTGPTLGRGGFILSQVDRLLTWSRANSIWPLTFGTSCCAIEMMSTGASRHDWSRFGFEVARATPRQSDLIVVAGTITFKMATRLRLLYEQMPEPKWVLAMGACATSGGPFFYDSYAVVKGVDRILRKSGMAGESLVAEVRALLHEHEASARSITHEKGAGG